MPLLKMVDRGRKQEAEKWVVSVVSSTIMQRCAVQGSPTTLTEITQVYQPGGHKEPQNIHLNCTLKSWFVGDTLITHKRTITETDIVNFANVSWDHFYAPPMWRDGNNLYRTYLLMDTSYCRLLPAYSLIRAKVGIAELWTGRMPFLKAGLCRYDNRCKAHR